MKEITIPGDGNCQYRSFAFCKEGNSQNYAFYKDKALNFIQQNPQKFSDFIQEENIPKYLESMEVEGGWGDEITLRALNNHYNAYVEDDFVEVEPNLKQNKKENKKNNSDEQSCEKGLLLIGRSQQGKSTFGNLILMKEIFGVEQQSGCIDYEINTLDESIDPEKLALMTSKEKIEELIQKNTTKKTIKIHVLDGPGVNDSDKNKEEQNMNDLFKKLSELKKKKGFSLSAIVLCISENSYFDDHQKETLLFYYKIFPEVFKTNFIVAVTNLSYDEQVIEDRLFDNKDHPDEQLKKVEKEIKNIYKGSEFKIYGVDSRPKPRQEKEKERVAQIRCEILDEVAKFPGISLESMKFPKHPQRLERDLKKSDYLKGVLEGDQEPLEGLEGEEKRTFMEMNSLKIRQDILDERILMYRNKLTALDTQEKILVRSENFNAQPWLFYVTQYKFKEEFTLPIVDVKTTYGSVEFDCQGTTVTGTCYGGLWKKYSGQLKFYTLSTHYYKDDIGKLTYSIQMIIEELSRNSDEMNKIQVSNSFLKDMIDKKREKNLKIIKEIKELESEYIPLDTFNEK
eukprot:gene3617-6433_t